MNRGVVSLAALIGGLVGYSLVRLRVFDTTHLTITLTKNGGELRSETDPSPVRVKKLTPMKWHVENDDLLGENETLQIVFDGVDSPLFEGHPKAKREGGKLRIKGRPHLFAKEWPNYTYKYDVVHVVDGVPQHPPIEDPEIQIEHI